MPKQESIIKLKGKLGDLTFYKSEDGYLARRKGGLDSERIKTDPVFERTRENIEEFSRAGKASKLIRAALRAHILTMADKRMTGRLTQTLVKVIRADATNVRGKRNVIDGEALLLQGFEFNINGPLGQTFHAPFTPTIDRTSGSLTVEIPAFDPGLMITKPEGATHCQLMAVGMEVDFEAELHSVQTANSETIALVSGLHGPLTLATNIASSTKPLMLAFGIQFYQQVNGQLYALKNGGYNSLALVRVDGGV